jgi:hypothetical protein
MAQSSRASGQGLDQLGHGEDEGIAGIAADVVALGEAGRRQDDVGAPGGGCPPGLVDDNGLGLRPGAGGPVEVLDVVEGVAAGPVDEAGVRQGDHAAGEGDGAARPLQHVDHAGDRDGALGRIGQAGRGRDEARPGRLPDGVHRAVAEAEAAARQADLAEDGGQSDRSPERHLAVPGALQRPGCGDQDAPGGQDLIGEAGEVGHGHVGDGGGPVEGLGVPSVRPSR